MDCWPLSIPAIELTCWGSFLHERAHAHVRVFAGVRLVHVRVRMRLHWRACQGLSLRLQQLDSVELYKNVAKDFGLRFVFNKLNFRRMTVRPSRGNEIGPF